MSSTHHVSAIIREVFAHARGHLDRHACCEWIAAMNASVSRSCLRHGSVRLDKRESTSAWVLAKRVCEPGDWPARERTLRPQAYSTACAPQICDLRSNLEVFGAGLQSEVRRLG
jgi:hypothetical protein